MENPVTYDLPNWLPVDQAPRDKLFAYWTEEADGARRFIGYAGYNPDSDLIVRQGPQGMTDLQSWFQYFGPPL